MKNALLWRTIAHRQSLRVLSLLLVANPDRALNCALSFYIGDPMKLRVLKQFSHFRLGAFVAKETIDVPDMSFNRNWRGNKISRHQNTINQ